MAKHQCQWAAWVRWRRYRILLSLSLSMIPMSWCLLVPNRTWRPLTSKPSKSFVFFERNCIPQYECIFNSKKSCVKGLTVLSLFFTPVVEAVSNMRNSARIRAIIPTLICISFTGVLGLTYLLHRPTLVSDGDELSSARIGNELRVDEDPLHPLASLKGPPTQSYKDNLQNQTKYITSWGSSAGWANDVITLMNLVYLGRITDRVPILPVFMSSHLPVNTPPLPFGDVFDLPRFRQALELPVLEWREVKEADSKVVDDVGCWNVWESVQYKEKSPRYSNVPHTLGLDISFTKTPEWIKMIPKYEHDQHSSFWSLATLAFPQTRNANIVPALPSAQHHLSLPPDEQLLCFDFLYYVAAHRPFEIGKDYSPAWRYVGQHMRWTAALEQLADEYIRHTLKVDPEDSIPPFVSVHARRDDFEGWCPEAVTIEECFASLPVIARRVDEVKAEILGRKGVTVEHVIITSDEKDQTWWDGVAEMGWSTPDHIGLDTEAKHGSWHPVLIDAVIHSRGIGFVGTDRSTFSILSARRVRSWHDGPVRLVKRHRNSQLILSSSKLLLSSFSAVSSVSFLPEMALGVLAAEAAGEAIGNQPSSTHPLVSLVSACFWVILWALSWLKWLVGFATITVPRNFFSILSYSMTLTLNFWSFAMIGVLAAIVLNYWIRFRYLNDYMQLKEPPLVKPDANELHPDVNTDPPATFHNYLDDFLQAVRVFGFLEKPVFHELARHLQTRRLIAGDSMSLDQDKSFYCVVDGMVQVFAQTGKDMEERIGTLEHEDMNGYQLLNEVGSGGTLSSLFTILSLFTEDVKMSWQDDESHSFEHNFPVMQRSDSDVPSLDLKNRTRRSSTSSAASTVHQELPLPPRAGSMSPLFVDEPEATASPHRPPLPSRTASMHRGVVARATEDTTLAVIPAEAFRRLTKKFPKATGHIVQVIITRFARVTFHAAHKYLGLTSEILRTELAMNDIACYPLPASFYEGGGLQQLRQRFDGTATSEDRDDYFTVTGSTPVMSPLPQSASSSGESLNSGSNSKVKIATPNPQRPSSSESGPFRIHTRNAVNAGDLMTSANQLNDMYPSFKRTLSVLNTPRVSRDQFPDAIHSRRSASMSGDEFDLRDEVMSCIARSIGLLQPPISGGESVEASPAFLPYDAASRRASNSEQLFSSSFGSLSLLDLGDDSSSITGSSTIASGDGSMSGLDNEVEILFFPAGSTLAKAGELNTGLFYVIEGVLDILLPEDETPVRKTTGDAPPSVADAEPWRTPGVKRKRPRQKLLFTAKPGGIAGYLAALCNTASYVDIKAKTDVYVGFLPSHALERLLERRPIVLLTLAKRLISLLSPLLLHIDASLDWMQVNAGQVLWRPEDISDSFYIVINGRLRAITEDDKGVVTITGEYGQGDTVGELDVITSSTRRNTVHAIRDTELIRMPQTLFNAISARNPETTAQLLRMIASRVRDEVDSSSSATQPRKSSDNNNLKTVAIIPVSRQVPVDAFARKLQAALEGIGATTSYLNQASISNHLGRHAFTRMGKLKAAGWLADQEQKYRTVLYVADSPVNSSWTQTCIRQADCVMVVGMGDDPSIGEYERLLLSMKTTARKELVLLHPDRTVVPGSTREWLKNRPWVHQHIHVELPGLVLPITKPPPHKDPDAVTTLKNLKDKVQSEIQKFRKSGVDPRPQRLPHINDFSRLARRICGKSIGLVLGGGGARGIAHLGLIRALEEYGIPIDHIGGTSIGAFIGGLYAREGDIISSAGRAKHFSGRMGNIWRILSDVTYPLVAYTTGHEFNRGIYKAFYDLHIEDMWLPFFCNTTNILTSRMEIHDNGYAWRFIRASMTLVGLLPPLCNDGGMLVDGGYMDNLPVSAMFSLGASSVFACDVGGLDDNTPRNFGDTISGWWLLINRWNPFSNARLVPPITEIQSRLQYVSSVKTLEDAKVARDCLYLSMPVQDYGTLQFSKFEELQAKGYEAAVAILEKLDEEGRLPSAFIDGKRETKGVKKGRSARRNSI
ncbi:lysophospholipase NTE1 [Favolaschia claudopus]|uniref:Lysophospholipase NTE1 n=1 Tax=Favolaschia claudopus TaxID=2862362 RepID=A0AAW0EFP7_9AGAR